jgi:hypothetical protein
MNACAYIPYIFIFAQPNLIFYFPVFPVNQHQTQNSYEHAIKCGNAHGNGMRILL